MSTHVMSSPAPDSPVIAFIGGGNMASAILGGLRERGVAATAFEVVEPDETARRSLSQKFGLSPQSAPGPVLARCALVVWAVKPQMFAEAAGAAAPFVRNALQLSVAAGIPSASIASWLGNQRIVRAMPNTPALIGRGMTGLYARAEAAAPQDRALVEQVLAPTGELLWVDEEPLLDTVTALSGSGPAYVYYFIEAMTKAGIDLGLSPEQAHRLAVGTFSGASELACRSDEQPATLRARVSSKGGTTHAAITALDEAGVQGHIEAAVRAAHRRAGELAREFGKI